MMSMDEADRRRRAEERDREVWLYWAAVEGERGERLLETSAGQVGLPVTSALNEGMAQMLFRARFGFDVRVMLLMLHGEPMRAPTPEGED